MTDTSPAAVEQATKYLRRMYGKDYSYAALIETLAAERDALASQLAAANARCEMLADSVGKARDDAVKKAAKVFADHEVITLERYCGLAGSWRHSIYNAILALGTPACGTKPAETAPQTSLCDTSEPQAYTQDDDLDDPFAKTAPAVTVRDEAAAVCVGCGNPATGMCWTMCGMSPCDAPICNECRHIDETHGWSHGPRAIAGGGDG